MIIENKVTKPRFRYSCILKIPEKLGMNILSLGISVWTNQFI